VFAAFSAALLVSAALGPHAGRAIDRWGGRVVLAGTNLVFAAGLFALAVAQGPWSLFIAWAVLGVGMGSGLYEAAFAALVRLYGTGSRGAITGITLIAGFASTVGWPLSALLESHVGWRGACLAWAALHLVLGMPLNLALPRAGPAPAPLADAAASAPVSRRQTQRAGLLLAVAFAATWFISTAMAAHLPRLLQASGATLAVAVAVGALVGPAQVAGRVLEFGWLRRVHPMLSARLAALMHPLGALALSLFGGPAAAAFALLHGAGNGILTIAKGTLPLVLFGPAGYGQRQGWLMVPARIAQALAPWLFGILLDRWGANAIWASAAIGLLAFASLSALRAPPAAVGAALPAASAR
jgi:MFS family permease